MRRALIILLLAVFTSGSHASDDFNARLVKFDQHYEAFKQTLCGWTHIPTTEPCLLDRGILDAREFGKARDAAKSLFDLK